MNRRRVMSVLGFAPVAVSSVASGSAVADYPVQPPLAGPALASGPTSQEVLRMAYKAGLVPDALLRRAVLEEHGRYRPFAHEKTIEGYRSFSAVAKHRLLEEARTDQAWQRFWADDEKSYYGIAENARKLLGLV